MTESLKPAVRHVGRRWCSKPYCVALTGVLLAVCIFAQLAFAQSGLNDYEGNQVVLGDTFSFATTEEAWDVIQRILDTVDGVRNVEFRISEDSGVPYAMAVYRDPGQRTIAYNPEFMQKAVNNNWVSLAILAHEVGHHINPHLPIHPSTNFHQAELDADYFSGVVLAKLGATLEQAQEAVRLYGNPVATVDHPATSQRLQAIEEGWQAGRNRSNSNILSPSQVDEFIRRAQAGGVIRLGAGTFILPRGLTLTNSIEIVGAGQDATIIRGRDDSFGATLWYNGSGSFALRGLTVEYAGQGWASVVAISNGEFDIRNTSIQGSKTVGDQSGAGVYIYGTAQGVIVDALIRNNDGAGVAASEEAHVVLHNNTIEGNRNSGVALRDSATGTVGVNRIRDNSGYGIYCVGNASFSEASGAISHNEQENLYCNDASSNVIAEEDHAPSCSHELSSWEINSRGNDCLVAEGYMVLGPGRFHWLPPRPLHGDVAIYGAGGQTVVVIANGSSNNLSFTGGGELDIADLTFEANERSFYGTLLEVTGGSLSLWNVRFLGSNNGRAVSIDGSTVEAFIWSSEFYSWDTAVDIQSAESAWVFDGEFRNNRQGLRVWQSERDPFFWTVS